MSKLVRNLFIFNFLIVLIACGHSVAGPLYKTHTLFVFYDAGETLALKPVLDELVEKQSDFKVLVMATARTLLKENYTIDLNKECGVKEDVDHVQWERYQNLSDESLGKVKQCVGADRIITGMVSKIQFQIAESFKQTSKVCGYYDGLSLPDPKSTLFSDFLKVLHTVLVPTSEMEKYTKHISSQSNVKVVGQPTLEVWRTTLESLEEKSIYKSLSLDMKRKMILYAGGYGEDYEKAFAIFSKASSQLKKYNVLVSLHPKVDGALESNILKLHGADHVKIIPKSISTMHAAKVADLIVTQRSSVGVQALFAGKSVIYLDVPSTTYKNTAIEKKWSPQISDSDEFLAVAKKILSNKKSAVKDIYSESGIPKDSKNSILNLILSKSI